MNACGCLRIGDRLIVTCPEADSLRAHRDHACAQLENRVTPNRLAAYARAVGELDDHYRAATPLRAA